MSARGITPDDGRDYASLVERAVAESTRAVDIVTTDHRNPDLLAHAAAIAVVRAINANTVAQLAQADRLDVLIGSLFDELRPIAVLEHEEPEEGDEP